MLNLQSRYETLIEDKSHFVLAAIVVFLLLMAFQSRHFTLDASAESLLLEGDPSLDYFREISERFGSQEFLVMTFTPNQPLFNNDSLIALQSLRNDIRALPRIESVVSVIDVPLLSNPPVPLTELVSNIKTLEDPNVNVEMARTELANSPLYVNLLLNLESNTTALQINFPIDQNKERLLDLRSDLRAQFAQTPTDSLSEQLKLADELIFQHNTEMADLLHNDIVAIRQIMRNYSDDAEMHLGGVPMIADDIIRFVRNDLIVFGLAVFALIVITLTLIFRQVRWVTLPVICATAVVVTMLGVLGWWRWPATVISSNFISLLLILTLSMNIHLVVRYRELLRKHPDWSHAKLVLTTVRRIAVPCLYMSLTTAVAFVSLLASGIRPVINFGWMMSVGIVVAFVMTFILFPSLLMVLPKRMDAGEDREGGLVTAILARFTVKHGRFIIASSAVIATFTVMGASRLIVENSFIDYFDEKTAIYQGMTVIDQRLGGTTPLEVIIEFSNSDIEELETSADKPLIDDTEPDTTNSTVTENDDFLNEEAFFIEDEFLEEDFLMMGEGAIGSFEDDFVEDENPEKYWFTSDRIADIKKVHQYLDELPQTGKVLSLATMIEIAEGFNEGEALTNLQLALLYSVVPAEFRSMVIDPYVSVDADQARINVRILDSMKGLQRNVLLQKIEQDMVNELGFDEGQVRLTGMMVLYNNLLQSLFSSQLLTLGAVFLGIMAMFSVLFRSLKVALIAMAPNLLAATLVLGLMGWLGIPLDIMTITIASITIGIAVDNTIHYIVRFKREYSKDLDYFGALERSHQSIGKAIFYTSSTIILGFSILALSNFKPTIYFGLLTAFAMAVALLGSMTLLPRLLLWAKPFNSVQPIENK